MRELASSRHRRGIRTGRRSSALANDGYPFIQKPFTGEELTRFIDRVLDARST